MKCSAIIPFVLGAVLQVVAQVADPNKAAELVVDLKNAPTQLARLNVLKNNRDVSTRLLLTLSTSPLIIGYGLVVV